MKQINKYILEHFENSKFSILERLHINKNTGEDIYCNSIKELSDKYDFNLSVSYSDTSWGGQQFNCAEYKVSNDLFKTNIGDKIIKLDDKEIIQYESNLCYHFKDILNNNYTIKLTNFNSDGHVWVIIQINKIENNRYIKYARALYNCKKSTIEFDILKDEKEAEKILINIIDYIANN